MPEVALRRRIKTKEPALVILNPSELQETKRFTLLVDRKKINLAVIKKFTLFAAPLSADSLSDWLKNGFLSKIATTEEVKFVGFLSQICIGELDEVFRSLVAETDEAPNVGIYPEPGPSLEKLGGSKNFSAIHCISPLVSCSVNFT